MTKSELIARLATRFPQLVAKDAELAAARNGLVISSLTIEKLKAQLAKLRREKFGSTSEQIERATGRPCREGKDGEVIAGGVAATGAVAGGSSEF